ncbi:MAG TPA: CPBP family glutamic-type intramembrane protease [Kofleriaceae bacterium]|nr:CPBP family glutamic-type intramembrane protease [Kofleriaceae bacterium]
MSRELRSLLPFEVAIVIAAALVPLPVPAVVPLLIVASISLWIRGRSWTDVIKGPPLYAAIGVLAGATALALALLVSTPLLEAITDYAVQWSMYPVVRGSGGTLVMVMIVVGVSAVAAELVLRGWLIDRVLELRGHPVLAILTGAIAEGLLSEGDLGMRVGAGLFGIGLGWMYVAGGRSVVAPVCARLVFSLGAVGLEALRLVG